MVVTKREKFHYSSFWLASLALLVVGGYSFWTKIPLGVRTRTMMEPVGMGLLLGVVVWMFLWMQTREEGEVDSQWKWLTVAGLVTAVSSLVVFLLPAAKMPILLPKDNPLLIINSGWSITGSLVAEIFLLLVLVVEWGTRMIRKLKAEGGSYVVEAVLTAVLGLAVMLDVYRIVRLGWVVLDGTSAWTIAVESLKRSPIFGMGMGMFLEGFTSLRPASYNLTKYWSMSFGQSSMGLLQVWTELGLAGLALASSMMFMVVAKGKRMFGSVDQWIKAVLVVAAVALLPLSLVSVFVAAWWLVMMGKNDKTASMRLKIGEAGFNIAPVVALVVFLGLTGGLFYYEFGLVGGEYYFRKSVLAASKNDGSATYNMQIKAIASNQNVADYRKAYSQTNMALALNLLQNKDATDNDKQKASVLVQQSVREAKVAVSLNSFNANYWANLAVIYKQIVGLVDGSADWSLQAYQQATALDPMNPLLKLDMGGLLFAAKNYEAADRIFEQVVTAKGDFANGWYNWSYTAKNSNRLADAVQRMTQAVALVSKDSADYEKANKDLTEWTKEYNDAVKKAEEQAKKQAQTVATPTPTPSVVTQLKTQEPLPTMGKEEKVNVPADELQPPVVSPTPTVMQ